MYEDIYSAVVVQAKKYNSKLKEPYGSYGPISVDTSKLMEFTVPNELKKSTRREFSSLANNNTLVIGNVIDAVSEFQKKQKPNPSEYKISQTFKGTISERISVLSKLEKEIDMLLSKV